MAKGAYLGVGGVAHKIKKMYVGVGGVAHKVKKAYIGVGGVAKLFWSGSNFRTLITAQDKNTYSSNEESPTSFTVVGSALDYAFSWIVYNKIHKCFYGFYNYSPFPLYRMAEDGTAWTLIGNIPGINALGSSSHKPYVDPTDGGMICRARQTGSSAAYDYKITVANNTISLTKSGLTSDYTYRTEKVGDYYISIKTVVGSSSSTKRYGYQYVNYSQTFTGTYTLNALREDTNSWSTAQISSDCPVCGLCPMHYVDGKYVTVWMQQTWDNDSGQLNHTTIFIWSGDNPSSMTRANLWLTCAYNSNYAAFAFNKGLFIVDKLETTMSGPSRLTPTGLWTVDFANATIGTLTRIGNIPWDTYSWYISAIKDCVYANGMLMLLMQYYNHQYMLAYTKNLSTWTIKDNIISAYPNKMAVIEND